MQSPIILFAPSHPSSHKVKSMPLLQGQCPVWPWFRAATPSIQDTLVPGPIAKLKQRSIRKELGKYQIWVRLIHSVVDDIKNLNPPLFLFVCLWPFDFVVCLSVPGFSEHRMWKNTVIFFLRDWLGGVCYHVRIVPWISCLVVHLNHLGKLEF